jgi:hypothetical protein
MQQGKTATIPLIAFGGPQAKTQSQRDCEPERGAPSP